MADHQNVKIHLIRTKIGTRWLYRSLVMNHHKKILEIKMVHENKKKLVDSGENRCSSVVAQLHRKINEVHHMSSILLSRT